MLDPDPADGIRSLLPERAALGCIARTPALAVPGPNVEVVPQTPLIVIRGGLGAGVPPSAVAGAPVGFAVALGPNVPPPPPPKAVSPAPRVNYNSFLRDALKEMLPQ